MQTEQQVETVVLLNTIEKMLTDYSNKYTGSSVYTSIAIELYCNVVRSQYQGLLLELGPEKVRSHEKFSLSDPTAEEYQRSFTHKRPEPDTLPPDSR